MPKTENLCKSCKKVSFDTCKAGFDQVEFDICSKKIAKCKCFEEREKFHIKITYEFEDKIAVVEKDVYDLPEVKWKDKQQGLGEFGNVFISDSDLKKLQDKYPDTYSDAIEALSRYIEIEPKKAKRYKNHYAVVCQWITRENKKQKQREQELSEREKRRANTGRLRSTATYDLERIKADAMNNTEL